LVVLDDIVDFFHLFDFLEPTVVVLIVVSGFLFVLVIHSFVFCKYFAGVFRFRIGLHQDFLLVEGLELNSAEAVGLDDGCEFGEIKFFALDH
jgi:hypothetical protein